MNLIYLIDLTEPLVCFNFIKTNQLTSPTLAHYETYGTEHPLYTIDPELLLSGSANQQIGFVSPRYKFVMISNLSNNDYSMGEGFENTRFYTSQELERIHRIARLEIEFEKGRRKINPQLPSRLCCLFVAEDNLDGRLMLKNMFYYKKNIHIAPIKVLPNRLHRADSRWIEEYEKSNDSTFIENYWKGIEFDENPQYEYLIDGIIELRNNEDREIIKSNFDQTPYYS